MSYIFFNTESVKVVRISLSKVNETNGKICGFQSWLNVQYNETIHKKFMEIVSVLDLDVDIVKPMHQCHVRTENIADNWTFISTLNFNRIKPYSCNITLRYLMFFLQKLIWKAYCIRKKWQLILIMVWRTLSTFTKNRYFQLRESILYDCTIWPLRLAFAKSIYLKIEFLCNHRDWPQNVQ